MITLHQILYNIHKNCSSFFFFKGYMNILVWSKAFLLDRWCILASHLFYVILRSSFLIIFSENVCVYSRFI